MPQKIKVEGRGTKLLIAAAIVGSLSMAVADGAEPGENMGKIELVCVDPEAHGYATFQAHNQKVVSNAQGFFMTHIRTRGEGYMAQEWRVLRSRDRGKTFEILFESISATNAPVIESDAAGNLYVMRPDFADHGGYLYRFVINEEGEYGEPLITAFPGAGSGKFAMALDEGRRQVYFFAHSGSLHTLGLDGQLKRKVQLLAKGEDAQPQYPHLQFDADGVLHAAWTNTKLGGKLYRDIHHMYSDDGGISWQTVPQIAVELPVVCDRHGPTLQVTLDDEFDVSTWLASFLPTGDKLHFLYRARFDPQRQHYMRFDRKTGRRDLDLSPEFGGETLKIGNSDGLLVGDAVGKAIYCVGSGPKGHIVCLVSRDAGQTWKDYARSEERYNAYALGGRREVTEDGWVIGSFTDHRGDNSIDDRQSKVYFFRIAADQ